MRVVGIVAEYNPFHNGHVYHIEQAKRQNKADAVLVIMSGSFVQRGEPAIADKFMRTQWALDSGADAVIELPDVLALSCAERFASGAVRILAGTGIVDTICFGSESGDIDFLMRTAEEATFNVDVASALDSGVSYPRALSLAHGRPLPPNDILAVEYIRAVKKYSPDMRITAITRIGSDYASAAFTGKYSSAHSIRKILTSDSDKSVLKDSLPSTVYDDIFKLEERGRLITSPESLSDIVLYRIRCMNANEIASLPDVSEGLENLFSPYCLSKRTYSEMLAAIKSKRYTMARLKRICMNAILGVDARLQNAAASQKDALYIRVLGIKSGAENLLAAIQQYATLPIVIRANDRKRLPDLAAKVEAISQIAHAVRALGHPYDKTAAPDMSYRLIVL